MHSPAIILTKAEDGEEAIVNTEEFMDDKIRNEIDWYVIGGRWSGVLNKEYNEFNKRAKKELEIKAEDKDFVMTMGNIKDNKDLLQEIWEEEFGKETCNPLNRDRYHEEGYSDDIMEAKKCEEVIRKKAVDREEKAEEAWNKGLEAKKNVEEGEMDFPEVYMEEFAKWRHDIFFFDSMTYDIDRWTNDPPKDLSGYYAVVVDMHT